MTPNERQRCSYQGCRTAKWVPLLALFLSYVSLLYGRMATVKSVRDSSEGSSLKVNVDLILVNATVTDHHQGFVTNLGREDFRVFEDKVEQTICQFSNVDLPASIGLVVDISGSMIDKMAQTREALAAFLKTSNQLDEYFLLTFANRPVMETTFTFDIASIQNRVAFKRAGGATTLYDAIYLALEGIKHSHNPQKAILLITDGEDTASRYSLSDVRQALQEADCQIFVIGILSPGLPDENLAFSVSDLLTEMADTTGGTAYFPGSASDLPTMCEQIAREIKSEYVLGYTPSNNTRDGRWRKIKVRVHAPKENHSLSIHAKRGYYAPSH
ncbi:MAG TPA: VWA domain-containing protein [Terriglobia bacterium]|nr:VWA domain-containing protein [Terriglobia bacterium]